MDVDERIEVYLIAAEAQLRVTQITELRSSRNRHRSQPLERHTVNVMVIRSPQWQGLPLYNDSVEILA